LKDAWYFRVIAIRAFYTSPAEVRVGVGVRVRVGFVEWQLNFTDTVYYSPTVSPSPALSTHTQV